MSFVTDIVDTITGGTQAADAATEAAQVQAAGGEGAIGVLEEAETTSRADLDPFAQAGLEALPGLTSLTTDPAAQLAFIQDNPFFQALTDQASSTLFANQAAKGKVGSGGTAEALQNSLLLLGTDLVNQNINQRLNLANLGFGAAAGQANITQQTGSNIANTITGVANTTAAGIVGGANAIQQGRADLLTAGVTAVCDIKLKENIKKVGQLDNGLPLYIFNYIGDNQLHINVMAQDVEKVKPEAVIEINNIKHVNMEEVWR